MRLVDVLAISPTDIADLLCNILGVFIENKSELPKMLEHIGYIDNIEDVILQVKKCETMYPDNWKINDFQIVSNEAKIGFEMDFILNAFADSFVLRIQGWFKANVTLTDCKENIQNFDPDDYKRYSEFVQIDNVEYYDIECDMAYL